MKEKIFLVGYRAVGKSTIGKRLADRLGFAFFDTDELICKAQARSVKEIVHQEGWQAFRTYEKEILQGLRVQTKSVIATGGGAILHQELWPELKKESLVVWLTAERQTLLARLAADSKSQELRPSLSGKNFHEELDETLRQREPLYKKFADIVIDTSRYGLNEALELVLKAVIEE